MTVFGDIFNVDYEGEIRGQGDHVIIRTTPTITIRDYDIAAGGEADGTFDSGNGLIYEVPVSANKDLYIDQAKSWSFRIDDIDEAMTDLKLMDNFASDAAERMKETIDADVLAYLYNQADSNNAGTTAGVISNDINLGTTGTTGENAIQLTSTNLVDYLVDMNTVLDEQNIPSENRWVVLPAWACGLLKKGELRRADVTGDSTGMIRTGLIGMVDRFKIYQSNNVYKVTETSTDTFYIHFGTKEAATFASQLVKTETLRIQQSFGTYFRGLNVFGRSVVQPKALGTLIAKK